MTATSQSLGIREIFLNHKMTPLPEAQAKQPNIRLATSVARRKTGGAYQLQYVLCGQTTLYSPKTRTLRSGASRTQALDRPVRRPGSQAGFRLLCGSADTSFGVLTPRRAERVLGRVVECRCRRVVDPVPCRRDGCLSPEPGCVADRGARSIWRCRSRSNATQSGLDGLHGLSRGSSGLGGPSASSVNKCNGGQAPSVSSGTLPPSIGGVPPD